MGRRGRAPVEHVSVRTGIGTAEVVPDRRRPRAASLLIEGQVHGHVDPDDPARLELDYQARLAVIVRALLPPTGGRLLHLGGGAFAIPRALGAGDPTLHQVVVERSGAIIRLAEQHLGLRRTPDLVVRKGDARVQVRRTPPVSVDVVVNDAFVDEHTPAHLTTVEFMAEVAAILRPGGAYVVNLVDEQPWSGLAACTAAAAAVFTDVLAAGSRGVARLRDPGNVLLVAANRPLDRAALAAALTGGAHPGALVADGQLRALTRAARARHDVDGAA